MRNPIFPLLLGAILSQAADLKVTKHVYPTARKTDTVDDYHGTKVADPYRWLEDTNSAETAAWVAAENKVTQEYFSHIPQREKIHSRLTELFNYERYSGITEVAGKYFMFRNNGLQNQDVLYVTAGPNGAERVLLDPNTLRADGTAALGAISIDHKGKLLAYSIAQAGSDWMEWHVRDIDTGKDLADMIQWTKFTDAGWLPDASGFYYQRFPQPSDKSALTASNKNAQVYFHKLGTPQSADRLIYQRPDEPHWIFGAAPSDDGRYLILNVQTSDTSRNLLFYQDLSQSNPKTVELIGKLTARFHYLGNQGSTFLMMTTENAPKGKVIAIDVTHPEKEHWRDIIAEQSETLTSAQFVDGKLILDYLKDAHSVAKIAGLNGRIEREVALPGLGTAAWRPAYQSEREVIYSFDSYTAPPTFYRYDLRSNQNVKFRASKLSFDPALYETEQVFYSSKDGTRVPMFLMHKKGLKRDGRNPTLLYGYGGFDISMTPNFSPTFLAWAEMGGVLAVANLRGGGEYGEAWHEAGMKLHKQNVFDDFIAAAEWLIANKYTSTPKLAIFGGSNGGLLIGAVLNQRPDLFGAAMPAVGVMDMLRFNKFTIGAAWEGDYGKPENPEEFKALYAYSPLHNIKPGAHYPPTLITTSDHDDRVVPGHSFKYAVTLQAAQGGPAPILIRIETRAGHGAGKPTTKRIDEAADRFAFLSKELHLE